MSLSKSLIIFTLLLIILLQYSCYQENSNKVKIRKESSNKVFQLSDFDKLETLHEKLNKPKPDEWLYVYKEVRQSFPEYFNMSPVHPTETRNKIYILPLGKFSEIEKKLIKNTSEYLHIFFMLDVETLASIPDKVIPNKSKRIIQGKEQLQTFYILDSILLPKIPEDAICYISITNKDLYPDNNWNYVFGQAYLTKLTGVSSYCRFFEKKLDSTNFKKCLERTIKTTTHEICHMFSLKHCVIYPCLVNGSNHLEEADNKPLWLCPECLAKLQWSIKFDLIKRYDSLIDFSNKNGFDKEKNFYMKSKLIMCN